MLLVRAEGRATLRNIQRKLATGEVPTNDLIDGGLLIAAGAFFLTPGLVTDLVGLLVAVPVTRYPIRAATRRFVVRPYIDAKTGGFASGQVYVGGFPNEEGPAADAGGASPGDAGPSDGGFDPDDATDVDFEEREKE
jgi:UPF0716 protein FxsA